ncbi:MAG: [protein-PII] uridylyltransferase [Candidatus Sumerlaeaceae bacterium]|nr:[protein-PII] uridylyltransferase [Candidatus Sumerlaeaceae bacterium]
MAKTAHESLPQFQLDLNAARRREFLVQANKDLAEARARAVKNVHRHGGLQSAGRFATDMDGILRGAFDWLVEEARLTEADCSRIAVIAQGGYGRGQLNLHSDIDLLFLLPDAPTPTEHALIKSYLYLLWDLNKIDLGYGAKKMNEALLAVGLDLDSTTALMNVRLIAGAQKPVDELSRRLTAQLRGASRKWFVESKLNEWKNRREKFGSSVYLLEPNVKDSEGGLRDIHSLQWMIYVLLESEDLNAVVEKDVLKAAELKTITDAMDFLLGVRTLLHDAEGRKVDVLSFEKQPAVAEALGYKSDVTLLAEEKMLKDYYLNARNVNRYVQKATGIMTARNSSKLRGVFDVIRRKSIGQNYFMKYGVLFLKEEDPDFFRKNPVRVMECFYLMAVNGAILSDAIKNLMEAAHRHTDTDEFRESAECCDYFMKIMGLRRHAAQTMHAMHETGILADYMPEFAKLFCLVRIDHYHRYTVDEHLIKTLEISEALINDEPGNRPELVQAAREIERWDLLNLALLLHDIGKGEGHGHVLRGAGISEQMAQRMGLPQFDRETVRQLVILHLKMVHISQRRDLEDPTVIKEMATAVQTPQLLRMLYILTYCDTKAVGPNTWNDWKASLLYDLYRKTLLFLEGKNPIPPIDEAATERLAIQVREKAAGIFVSEDITVFLNSVQPKYLNVVPPAKMVRHLEMLQKLDEETLFYWETDEPENLDYTEITAVSFDKPGFMSLVCGALASKNVNILSMQAFSTKDGHIIDIFQVTDVHGRKLPHGFRLDRLRSDINRVLQGKTEAREVFPVQPRQRPVKADLVTLKPSQIIFNNEGSPSFTILEVKAYDRPGLLYDVTSVCAEERINIHLALITTEAYRVVDVFYVTDLDYNKLETPKIKKLTARLEAVIS